MKVMILGIDGYLGWALALRLAADGHEVSGIDNLYTRKAVEEVGSTTALPISSPEERITAAKEVMGVDIRFYEGDITKYAFLQKTIRKENPEAIVHFAEQRSAPYSMIDVKHANYTLTNNLSGTVNLIYAVRKVDPRIHIVKMGTMGEFGTPKFDIPEAAFIDVSINGKEDRITVPKWGGSWYHWSKVHDTNNLLFANRLWGLTMTDIMQGPVYGSRIPEIKDPRLFTRLDFDEVWGTVLNRYCVEAVLGMPLTQYGQGGQTRAFLSLEDSVHSLSLLIDNPPEHGNYRVANQFTELYSVRQLAEMTKEIAKQLGINVQIKEFENPRVELEKHYYNPEIKVLPALGLTAPRRNIRDELKVMIRDVMENKERLEPYRGVIAPKTKWR